MVRAGASSPSRTPSLSALQIDSAIATGFGATELWFFFSVSKTLEENILEGFTRDPLISLLLFFFGDLLLLNFSAWCLS